MRSRLIAASIACLLTTSACRTAPAPAGPPASQLFCWQSLAPDTGPQNLNLAIMTPSLVATSGREAWIGWDDEQAHVRQWADGQWTPAPPLVRHGTDGLWQPLLAASPSGRVYVLGEATNEHHITALHVGRSNGTSWEWLGAPLIASPEPYTHVGPSAIAFAGPDRPIVAWSEGRDAQLTGLFVARWDGAAWTRLGAIDPEADDTSLTPALAVDAERRIWLAWPDAKGAIRVMRWDDSRWAEVDAPGLRAVITTQGTTAFRDLSLAVDRAGNAWVLRPVYTGTHGLSLAIARWDGRQWSDVPAPRVPVGKEATVRSSAMVLRDDAPLVGWSQADASDNHYLFVSQWTSTGWTPRVSGLHLAEGVSNVTDVSLAVGDAHTVFMAWDENGSDERRTRLVRAYTCAEGETPAAPPRSIVERDTWPVTVDAAARQIVAKMDDESKAQVRATAKQDLIQFHLGWGTGIRNSLGLWRGNHQLLESCGRGTRVHPDDCSTVIIEAVWELLRLPSR